MKKSIHTIGLSFLVLGNLVGAGILGLPTVTGMAGFIPSFTMLVIFCAAMYYSALVLSDENLETRDETFNYPSVYKKYLGHTGKWLAIAANLLIFYGALTAYLAGGTQIIISLFHINSNHKFVLTLFFLLLTSLTLRGFFFIERFNLFLVILKWVAFLLIVILGLKYIDINNLQIQNWKFAHQTLPIILCAFCFHNIIPNICSGANWDKKIVRNAMLLGILMGLIMNAMWILVGIGIVPLKGGINSIEYCYAHNLTAVIPMANILNWKYFTLFTLIFSMIGMFTAYLTQGMGLLGFSKDLTIHFFKTRSKLLEIIITFGPPLCVALINPNIFIKALDTAGAFGIAVLFGILPGGIAVFKSKNNLSMRIIGIVLLCLFTFIVLTQILIDLKSFHLIIPVTHFGFLDKIIAQIIY